MAGDLYVVYGSSGESDDYSWWNVKAFTSRERAEQFKCECELQAKIAQAAYDKIYSEWSKLKRPRNLMEPEWLTRYNQFRASTEAIRHPLDPHWNSSHNHGASYHITEIDLDESSRWSADYAVREMSRYYY